MAANIASVFCKPDAEDAWPGSPEIEPDIFKLERDRRNNGKERRIAGKSSVSSFLQRAKAIEFERRENQLRSNTTAFQYRVK